MASVLSRFAAVAVVSLAAPGCQVSTPSAVNSELAACVPSDTMVLAGVHLDRLRANPEFRQLSAAWSVLFDRVRDATYVLVAYDGKDLLFIARGNFAAAPPGATLLTPHLALAGPAGMVRAATAQHATGRVAAAALLAHSESVAEQPVWAVVPGGVTLPLAGNGANLNRFLRYTDYATFSLEWNSGVTLRATGAGRSQDAARQLEESLRGFVSLAAAAIRDRDLASLLASVSVRRDGLMVHADLAAGPSELDKLLRLAVR